MDLAIRNATIIDGTGSPRRVGDIGVASGRIVALDKVTGRAAKEIDAKGAVAAPGFIDVHTHYDAQALWDRMLSPSVYHGVTSVIAGHCGFTLAPLSGDPEDADYLLRMLSRVEGMPLATLRSSVKPTWTTFGEYLDHVDGTLAVNTVFLVGHSALRRAVMRGRAVGHEATDEEIEAMCSLLDTSLSEGGAGFSTTVSGAHSDFEGQPVPSRWASMEEILRLAKVLRRHPGTWVEVAPYSLPPGPREYQLLSDIALAARRPVNWNLVVVNSLDPDGLESQLRATDFAKERGADVWGLVPSAAPKVVLNLVTGFILDMIPGWKEVLLLDEEQKQGALADPDIRAKMRAGAAGLTGSIQKRMFGDWGKHTIESVASSKNQRWVGKTLAEYSSSIGKEPFEALLDLAIEEDLKVSFSPPADGEDDATWAMRARAWQDERLIVGGSDAGAHLDMINTFAISTQLLGEGVRRRGLISLESAIRLLTAVPASRFGLVGRGSLSIGAAADIVIFDPDEVDCGPIEMRFDLPEHAGRLTADAPGMRHVIVNGVEVARNGAPTGELGGRVLRSGADTQPVASAA